MSSLGAQVICVGFVGFRLGNYIYFKQVIIVLPYLPFSMVSTRFPRCWKISTVDRLLDLYDRISLQTKLLILAWKYVTRYYISRDMTKPTK